VRIKKSIGVLSAISIGVGGMVGARIFSILGIATEISGNALTISFIIAGIVAFLSTYSYAKLGAKPYLIWSSIVGCFASLGILLYYETNNSPVAVAVLATVFFLSFIAEGVYRKYSQRLLKTRT
jgi:hypothetical protein